MKKSIVLILSLCLLLTACGSKEKEKKKSATEESKTTVTQEAAKDTPKESDEEKTATAETKEFSFVYPASWEAVDLAKLNQPLVKAAYANPDTKAAFADNVNVTGAANNSDATAKAIADATVAQYESGAFGDAIKNYKKISYDDKANNSGVLIGEYTQGQSGVQVVVAQYIVPASPNMYTLSISYTKESYDKGGKEMVQKMVDSFKVTQTAATATQSAAPDASAAAASSDQMTIADFMSKLVPAFAGKDGEMSEATYNYIASHSDLFPAVTAESKNKAKSLVDASITSRHIFKNITPYLDKMVQVKGTVIEIVEENIENIGPMAIFHVMDKNQKSHTGIYMGATGDILQDDEVIMCGVPTTIFSFANSNGGTDQGILLIVSTVQKK
ncbi:PsbP-related protein [Paenibacillus azoreducens]|uniref:PsbP C-terminal domain-containing protein n=1 Tax=Paenibacillus azoreducens TaxID=116718 RepID=A0A919YFB0_9BACL|nr:PsbP-related protein [Paenibacillus azoreducens]GIO50147.1 hypothetical protein J34TS1_49120 [Paenibacillus azoreducens]